MYFIKELFKTPFFQSHFLHHSVRICRTVLKNPLAQIKKNIFTIKYHFIQISKLIISFFYYIKTNTIILKQITKTSDHLIIMQLKHYFQI